MNKPKGMSDEEWGKLLFECAMGPHSDPPPLWMTLLVVGLLLFAAGIALWP